MAGLELENQARTGPLGRLDLQGERQVRAGSTCVIMVEGARAGSWSWGLLLVNHRVLEDGLLERGLLVDGRVVNIGTHRGHIVVLSIVLRVVLRLVVARTVSVDVGSVGGVGHLGLEMDARVGRVHVASHGDDSRLTKVGDDARGDWMRLRLAWIVDEVGGRNWLAVREGLIERLIEGSGVVNKNLLTGSRNWRGVVVHRHSRSSSWASGRWGRGLLVGLLIRIVGRSTGGGSRRLGR